MYIIASVVTARNSRVFRMYDRRKYPRLTSIPVFRASLDVSVFKCTYQTGSSYLNNPLYRLFV